MIFMGYLQIIGTVLGLVLIFYATRYRTEDYPSFLQRNPFAIVRLGELRNHFTGPGIAIHKTGVILFTIGLFSGAVFLMERWIVS